MIVVDPVTVARREDDDLTVERENIVTVPVRETETVTMNLPQTGTALIVIMLAVVLEEVEVEAAVQGMRGSIVVAAAADIER